MPIVAGAAFHRFLVAIEEFQTLDDALATKEAKAKAKEAKEAAQELQTVLWA